MIFPAPSGTQAIYIADDGAARGVTAVPIVGYAQKPSDVRWLPLVMLHSGRLGSPQELREQFEVSIGPTVYAGAGSVIRGVTTLIELQAFRGRYDAQSFIKWVDENRDVIEQLLR